ncbi:MAG: hypothetical protein EA412_10255 [Chitinophagaceae bacterium]|nr:MAG: hypothetical protein EA412_10255 [Chitinophagaceae bacterium]
MLIYKGRKWIVFIYLLISVVAGFYALRINVVYDFEAFFPSTDTDYAFYRDFREQFEPDDNVLFVAFNREEGLYNQEFLQETKLITEELKTLPHVLSVISLHTIQRPLQTPLGLTSISALNIDRPERYSSDSLKIAGDPIVNGKLISEDATTLNIVLETEQFLTQEQAENLNDSLFALLEKKAPHLKWHVAGRANIQTVFVRKQLEEMQKYILISAVIVLLALYLIFRSIRLTIIAFTSVIIALVIFMGILGFFRVPLDFMSTLFPIIMLIVGMSDMVHILSAYTDGVYKGDDRKVIVKRILKEIGTALLLTSITTSIGFLSLQSSQIEPIRNFGLLAALGVFIAFLVTITFSTSCLLLLNDKKMKSRWRLIRRLEALALRVNGISISHEKKILGVGLILLLIGFYGISTISTDARLKSDLPANERITDDFEFYEEKLGGFRPLELALIPAEGKKTDDYRTALEIEKVTRYLRAHPDFSGIISPVDIYKSLHRAHNGDRNSFFHLPGDENTFERYKRLAANFPKGLGVVQTKDRDIARLSGKMEDVGSYKAKELMQQFDNWFNENIDIELLSYRFTGNGVLFDNNNQYLIKSLLSGLGLAFLVVSVLMAFLFRSFKMVLISLIPNVFPLILTAAFMGFAGVVLDAPTSIIFAIAFGIAVDDTIHFLSRFKLNLASGMPVHRAVQNMMRVTGKAVGLTTIILFMGFMVLTTSDYDSTFKVGLLISITLAIAFIADLFIVPVLLRKFIKDKS